MPQFDDTQMNATLQGLHEKEEERLTETLAPKYGLPYINLHTVMVDSEVVKMIPEADARKAELVAFASENGVIRVAVRNPKNPDVEFVTKPLNTEEQKVELYLATQNGIEKVWECYKKAAKLQATEGGMLDIDPELIKQFIDQVETHLDVATKLSEILRDKSPRQTSLLISIVFGGALALKASDIHIEPEAETVRVRYRIDGVLRDISNLDNNSAKHLTQRVKLLAGTKLNVTKEAQDGRFTFDLGTREVEVRTSVIPGAYGESLVMRLLDPDSSSFKIENLGMSARIHEVILEELERPNGAIVTTGPTGSGKTTALYSFLLHIHTPDIKIITLEDPIEYKLPGVVQTQVEKNYSFASGLRTILRQDPDVILVGEIRDKEVATTAMHAALTGHLVFSTLHTNSAAGAIPRLVDMGIEAQTIGSACNIFLGQRLVRKLCDSCKVERQITTEEKKLVERILEQPVAIDSIFENKGCDVCGGSGYVGRIGVFEAVRIDEKVEEAILKDTRETFIKEVAKHQNIPSMQQDGLMKVLAGITSLDEVTRVLDLYSLE